MSPPPFARDAAVRADVAGFLAQPDVGARMLDADDFKQAVSVALEQARDAGVPCSLLSVSIDRLNPRDQGAARRAMSRIAGDCGALLREEDRVGLIDPRHFMVLLTGTLAKNALRVAERLRAAVALPESGDALPPAGPRFTVSIGVVTSRTGLSDYPALRSRADAKRDDAQQRGGNRING